MDIALNIYSQHPLRLLVKRLVRRLAIAVCFMMGLTACGDGASSSPNSGVGGSISGLTATPQGQLPVQDAPEATLNDNSFLLTTNETRLYRVSTATGAATEITTFGGGIEFVEPLDLIDNTVFTTADDNTVNAIDLNTGKLLWEVYLGNSSYLVNPSGVVCDSQTCWARGATGLLMAVAATDGRVKWSTPLHPNGAGNEDKLNGSDLLVTSDRIYLSIHKLRGTTAYPDLVAPAMMIIDRSDGSIIKKLDLEYAAFGVPSVIGNTLLISTYGEILAYDKNSFQLLWRINDPALGYTSTAVIVDNVVVAGTYDDNDHYIAGVCVIT